MNEFQDEQKAIFFKRLKQVTPQQFVHFLTFRNVVNACPGCGRNNEQIIDESHHTTLEKMANDDEPTVFVTFFKHQSAIPGDSDINYYYKLTCEHCGYITMHSVTPVLTWLDSAGLKENGDRDE